jgi:glutathione S-transferase
MSSEKITLYYWPLFARAGALFRMLEEKGVPYEHKSSKEEMAAKASVFGASGVNIAPPIIEDGGAIISQSTACAMYLGKKLGFDKGVDPCLSVQYLLDIVDVFEGGVGKNNEDAGLLKKFMEGDDGKPSRWSAVAGTIERNIQGPYFFGAEPSYVDFFLLQHMDWRKDMFDKLQAKTGKDFLVGYPKMKAVSEGLRSLDSYKNYKGELKTTATFNQAVIDAYTV